MAYRLERDESVQDGVRRIAGEQIKAMLAELADESISAHDTVHQVRKRCKKVRSLIRLVRPAFSAYKKENAMFRDAARGLSNVRDATTIHETAEQLLDFYEQQIQRDAFEPILQELHRRRVVIFENDATIDDRLEDFEAQMHVARDRAAHWELDGDGFNACGPGFRTTYARGCGAMKAAYENPTTEKFHEWRKHTKYHWQHLRLLRDVWKDVVNPRRDLAEEVSNRLGDDHDLAVLRETLLDRGDRRHGSNNGQSNGFGCSRAVQVMIGLIDRRRLDLLAEARLLGVRLYAEKPKALARGYRTWFETWRGGVHV